MSSGAGQRGSLLRARLLWAACTLFACDPPKGPFRPSPPLAPDVPVCGNLPRLAATAEILPIIDRDLDGDRQHDYIVTRADTCDELGNCDRDLYLVRESCAVAVGTMRAHDFKEEYGVLIAIEEVMLGEDKGNREHRWVLDASTHRFRSAGDPVCKKRGSTEAVPCDPGAPGEPAAARPEDPYGP